MVEGQPNLSRTKKKTKRKQAEFSKNLYDGPTQGQKGRNQEARIAEKGVGREGITLGLGKRQGACLQNQERELVKKRPARKKSKGSHTARCHCPKTVLTLESLLLQNARGQRADDRR